MDKDLEEKIAARHGEKVTMEYMQSRVHLVKYHKLGPTLTHCTIYLDNGFSVTGESACVDLVNYDKEIGERLALAQATDKLWPLFGFLLAEERYHRLV